MPESLALAERQAVMDAEVRAHIRADETAFARINQDTAEIKTAVRELTAEVKQSFSRVHERIEDEAGKSRHALNNAAQVALSDNRTAAKMAQEAQDQVVDLGSDLNEKISGQKVWILTAFISLMLGVFAWAADHFAGGHR